MRYKKSRRKMLKPKTLGLVILAVLLVGLGSWYLVHRHNNQLPQSPNPDTSTIKYAPATSQEKQADDAHKNDLSKDQTNPPPATTTPSGRVQVTPVITSATTSQVKAYVSGVVEDGGSCIFTFTNGTSSFTKTSSGFSNVSTTNCTPVSVSPSDFSGGGWSVTLHYLSNKYEGTSASTKVQ